MRTILSVLVLIGVGIAILWLRPLVLPPRDGGEEPPVEARTDEERPTVREPPSVRHARRIAPEIIAVPEFEAERLRREEARPPLSPLGIAPDPADLPPRQRVLHRPVALAAGLVEVQGHRIALAGIAPTDPDEMCERDGLSWPCGVHARTAFRNYLRARALSCTVPAVPARETVMVDCDLAGQDPALWLAENGWVREGGAAYAEAIAMAREAGRGLFGPPPQNPDSR